MRSRCRARRTRTTLAFAKANAKKNNDTRPLGCRDRSARVLNCFGETTEWGASWITRRPNRAHRQWYPPTVNGIQNVFLPRQPDQPLRLLIWSLPQCRRSRSRFRFLETSRSRRSVLMKPEMGDANISRECPLAPNVRTIPYPHCLPCAPPDRASARRRRRIESPSRRASDDQRARRRRRPRARRRRRRRVDDTEAPNRIA